jgi:predicted HNH restriction endonuclease
MCQQCGKTPKDTGKALDVHHIQPFRTFGVARHADANALSNLIALCSRCHLRTEWEARRRSLTPMPPTTAAT